MMDISFLGSCYLGPVPRINATTVAGYLISTNYIPTLTLITFMPCGDAPTLLNALRHHPVYDIPDGIGRLVRTMGCGVSDIQGSADLRPGDLGREKPARLDGLSNNGIGQDRKTKAAFYQVSLRGNGINLKCNIQSQFAFTGCGIYAIPKAETTAG